MRNNQIYLALIATNNCNLNQLFVDDNTDKTTANGWYSCCKDFNEHNHGPISPIFNCAKLKAGTYTILNKKFSELPEGSAVKLPRSCVIKKYLSLDVEMNIHIWNERTRLLQ